jgi:hypothetical protein
MNVNNRLSCIARPVAFEFTEGTVRTFQIAFIAAKDDDHIVDS